VNDPADGTTGAVLLVEDDSNDVLLMRRAFRAAGLDVALQVVSDGMAAIEYLSGVGPFADRVRYPLPSLMLLDLKLPRRSGHEVLAWLRQEPAVRRLPVVVLTSSREAADVERAYDLGANSYLVKPIGGGALVKLVETLGRYWLACNERPEL
jgi:CheY-like chemotaxis protein